MTDYCKSKNFIFFLQTVSGFCWVTGLSCLNPFVEIYHLEMDAEVLEGLKMFALSGLEDQGVELGDEDVHIGVEEGQRSLIGKVFGEKRANFLGIKNTMLKLWHHKGLCKVVGLGHNFFQFVFAQVQDLGCYFTRLSMVF